MCRRRASVSVVLCNFMRCGILSNITIDKKKWSENQIFNLHKKYRKSFGLRFCSLCVFFIILFPAFILFLVSHQ